MKNVKFLHFIRNSHFKYHKKSMECTKIVFTITDQEGYPHNIGCPTRYRTRHWRYCNEIWTGIRSLCEKWRGMCLYCT